MAKISIKRMSKNIQAATFSVMGSLLCAKAADAVQSPQAAEASMGFFGRAFLSAPAAFVGFLGGAVLGLVLEGIFGDPENDDGPAGAVFRCGVLGAVATGVYTFAKLG